MDEGRGAEGEVEVVPDAPTNMKGQLPARLREVHAADEGQDAGTTPTRTARDLDRAHPPSRTSMRWTRTTETTISCAWMARCASPRVPHPSFRYTHMEREVGLLLLLLPPLRSFLP